MIHTFCAPTLHVYQAYMCCVYLWSVRTNVKEMLNMTLFWYLQIQIFGMSSYEKTHYFFWTVAEVNLAYTSTLKKVLDRTRTIQAKV